MREWWARARKTLRSSVDYVPAQRLRPWEPDPAGAAGRRGIAACFASVAAFRVGPGLFFLFLP